MEYQYIKKDEEQLYSVYHPPINLNANNTTGVIMCYPLGQEYIRCHKMFVNLSNKLALLGFNVLRFDYSGTGDSSGDFMDVTLNTCLADISLAIQELKDTCNLEKVILVGARLGAYLASTFAKDKGIVDGLVLLSPVLNGSNYLTQIEKEYQTWLKGSFAKEKNMPNGIISSFGYNFSADLAKQIKEINLKKQDLANSFPSLLIDTNDLLGVGNLRSSTFYNLQNHDFWIKHEDSVDKSIVPVYEINTISNWISTLTLNERGNH